MSPVYYVKDVSGRTFHKTILNEFYQTAFRKKIYKTIEELQTDLDSWLEYYNERRTHQGKMCNGRTPYETFIDGLRINKEKAWPKYSELG